jgi:hypothetical protein
MNSETPPRRLNETGDHYPHDCGARHSSLGEALLLGKSKHLIVIALTRASTPDLHSPETADLEQRTTFTEHRGADVTFL